MDPFYNIVLAPLPSKQQPLPPALAVKVVMFEVAMNMIAEYQLWHTSLCINIHYTTASHSIQHTAYDIQHTAHSTQRTQHIAHTAHTAHSTQHTAHATQHTSLHTTYSTQHTAHNIQHTTAQHQHSSSTFLAASIIAISIIACCCHNKLLWQTTPSHTKLMML